MSTPDTTTDTLTDAQQAAVDAAVQAALAAAGVKPADDAEETETAHVPILERVEQLAHDIEHDTNELKLDTLTKEGYAADPVGVLAEIVFALAGKLA